MIILRCLMRSSSANYGYLSIMVALFVFFFTISAWAVTPELTYVEGDIWNDEWTEAESPYVVTGNIQVYGRLYINAGVEVQFDGNYCIEVESDAVLIAEGGEEEGRILFTSASYMWQGIRFVSASNTSVIENCDLINAATAISCVQSDIEILGTRIEANNIAISCNRSSPNIHDNLVIRVRGVSEVPANYVAISIFDQSNPLIRNNLIECSAFLSGNATGIYIWESGPRIEENRIEVSSYAEVSAIEADYADDTNIIRNIIRVKTAPSTRGLDFEHSTDMRVFNNSIIIFGSPINNSVGVRAGAGSLVILINNIILGNDENFGVGLLSQNQNMVGSGYNLIYRFQSIYSDGFAELTGDIVSDPLFIHEDYDPAVADYHLHWRSPCIDEGYPDEEWYDPDSTRSDIGRHRYERPVSVPEINSISPNDFILFPAYPNPFNSLTTVSFFLPVQSNVRVLIFDLSGRTIRLLGDGEFQSGAHNIEWNAGDHSAGIYILRLEVDGISQNRRLVYLP